MDNFYGKFNDSVILTILLSAYGCKIYNSYSIGMGGALLTGWHSDVFIRGLPPSFSSLPSYFAIFR